MIRKNAFIILLILALGMPIFAFKIKDATGKFDIAAGAVESMSTSCQFQAVYNLNETFYTGVRYSAGSQVSYFSEVSRSADIAYNMSINNIDFIFGAQFAQINERFNMYFQLLPGFAFSTRQRGTASVDNLEMITMNKVLQTEDQEVFFSPAVEIGFACHLTDNLIISTGWLVRQIKIKDMEWAHYPWLIKLGEQDAFSFSVPVILAWRF